MKKFNAVLQLRRDNDYNYAKIAESFIPAKGEICLVDTARSGLRAVCGDGTTTFGKLEYVNNVFVKGYLQDNTFFKDAAKTETYENNTNLIYIDLNTNAICYFDGENYQTISREGIPTANASTPGIMKLYTTIGSNEDGTMTQKAITDELNEKFEIELDVEQELIIFTND